MDYSNYTRQRAAELGLDPNLAHALMLAESSGNPNAVSPVGALGLLQLMPGTAKQLGVDPRDPLQNIDGGLRYLKQNIDKFGIAGGLAAYNAGPGRVQKTDDFNQLPAETRNYVPKVMNMAADLAEKQQGTAPKTLDIPTLMSGLEKAKAAQDSDSVKEINGLLMQKYQGALQKAQAANDAEAVQEITNAMKSFGPEMQPAPDTPMARGRPTMQNDPRIVDPNAPAPKAPEKPSMAARAFQTVDDYVRAAANGLTFGLADRAAAAGDAVFGKGDYKTNVKQERAQSEAAHQRNPYGYKAVEFGSGLALPGGAAIKGLEKAAPVVGNAAAGALYGGLSGLGAESGDTDAGKALTNAATGAVIGAPTGAILTPVIGKAAEAVSGAVPWIDQKLTKGYIAKTFQNNPTAKVDAEITRDIGLLKNGTDKTIKPVVMNDLEKRYVDEARMLAERSGMLDGNDVANLSIDRYRSLLADPAKLQQLQSYPVGRALVDNLQKASRANELTQSIEANNGMLPKLGRTFVDSGLLDAGIMSATGLPVPIASAARAGVKKALGGNETRTEVINQVGSPRALKAADQFLATNGPSDATKSMGILQQAADDRLARDMALGREAAAAKRTAMAEATKAAEEKAAQAAQQQAEKEAIKEGGRIQAERKASESALAQAEAERVAQEAAKKQRGAVDNLAGLSEKEKAEAIANIADVTSKDPTFLLGLSNPHGVPRNETQMKEFSSVLKAQMEKRVTKEVEEKATSLMDKALGGDHSELSVSSPAFKTTAGALGFEPDRLKSELLTLAEENPKLKTAIGKMFTSGVSPSKKEFYRIQDMIAEKYGITTKNPNAGVLNSTPVSNGALSEATNKSSSIANFVRGLPDDQVKTIVGRDADTLGKDIKSMKGYAVGKLSKIVDDIQAGKDVPQADLELVKRLGLM